ncbi:hypothetical protein BC629DRAFT_1550349 [Irpex lacteus]|nr:hypothetical protein BC629DRAFT_1550349 [Irpex lacteus]
MDLLLYAAWRTGKAYCKGKCRYCGLTCLVISDREDEVKQSSAKALRDAADRVTLDGGPRAPSEQTSLC